MEIYKAPRKDPFKEPSLNRILRAYRPFWYLFLILYTIVGLLSFVYVRTSIPLYESFTSVLIK